MRVKGRVMYLTDKRHKNIYKTKSIYSPNREKNDLLPPGYACVFETLGVHNIATANSCCLMPGLSNATPCAVSC